MIQSLKVKLKIFIFTDPRAKRKFRFFNRKTEPKRTRTRK